MNNIILHKKATYLRKERYHHQQNKVLIEKCNNKFAFLNLEIGSEFIYKRIIEPSGKEVIHLCRLTAGANEFKCVGDVRYSPFIKYDILASNSDAQVHYINLKDFLKARITMPDQDGCEEAKKLAMESGIRCVPPKGERVAPFKEKGFLVNPCNVETPDGIGVVIDRNFDRQILKVHIENPPKRKWYGIEECTPTSVKV